MKINIECNLPLTLCGGQAFRFTEISENIFKGIVGKYPALITKTADGIEINSKKALNFWENYFGSDVDYTKIIKQISKDEIVKTCVKEIGVIRILRQEPFETLISFIISQNNNIKRIRGIVERLCEFFGEPVFDENISSETFFKFPSAERLAVLSEEDLQPIRAGFRAKYILNAARAVLYGEVGLEKISSGYDYEKAKTELIKIKGVGEKIADCVLLFGFGRLDVFPKDVWVKRICAENYASGLPECFDGVRGVAQQYLFESFRKR